VKGAFQATKYQGDTGLTIPPFFKNAGRGKERIWGEEIATPQPTIINWSGLDNKEKLDLIPSLSATDNWILLTHPLGASNKTQPPFRETQLIARADGKCSRHKGWWWEEKDNLATHSTTTEVWQSTRGKIPEITRIAIQESLEADNTKDTPSFGLENLEEIHRAGTEAGLLGIYNFPGAVYATDRFNDKGVMGAGYYRLDENKGGCCQLGRGEEGNFSNRAELGAACLALEDAKRKQDRIPVIFLSDSACFLYSSQKWIGEGKSPSMWGNPDVDIMRDIVQLLRERIEQGLLTVFIKIKVHRGESLNKLADRWADEGRQSEYIRWSLPTNRPIFSWTENSLRHQSPMNPTVKKRIDSQVSWQQLKTQTGSTAKFLTREDNSRDLLGKFHKDRSVWIRARQRVLQCLSYQFSCALQLKKWGILNDVKCRLCEKYYKEKKITEPPDSVESVGHIQCYCPVLHLPRIAIHHGIWRELMFSIRKSSTELNDTLEPRWHFPSALSPEAHAGWGLYKIWNTWDYTRSSHQKRDRIEPNFKKISKNTTWPTKSTLTKEA